MGERTLTQTYCDRPGCDNRVTGKGGHSVVIRASGVVEEPDELEALEPVDLCRECLESLRVWWTARDRRRQAKGDLS